DLMLLCNADITSKNESKVKRYKDNYQLVKQKLIDIEEKDRLRNFQPPIDGTEIMDIYGLTPSRPVGIIKDAIKDAILDGVIQNNREEAYEYMLKKAAELGLQPVK
ncbi:MAG: tRNA nucleotidyltransferase, partial [Sodaliphilus sp.]|nr:tRNA nucleotidyltransferase [Sodaliphilus sp.]